MLILLLSLLASAGPAEDAQAAYDSGKYKKAAKLWEAAIEQGFTAPWLAEYNMACALALAGSSKKAMAALQRAVDAGFGNPEGLQADGDLVSLRGADGWDRVVSGAKKNAAPCTFDPRFGEFDFFLGDWELYTAAGVLAGTNHIEKVQRGCAITESWTGRSGRTGTSLTTLNPSTGDWGQLWMSDAGWRIWMEGRRTDEGTMVLAGPDSQLPNVATLARTTWTPNPDGSVGYQMEASSDAGKTWNITFQGVYKRPAAQ